MSMVTKIESHQGSCRVKLDIGGDSIAYIEAVRVEDGADGVHTYRWEWGIPTGYSPYEKIDSGVLQHRASDGSFALLAKILERIRGRKADQ